MSRPLRFDRPNLFHHVMARGNNKHDIFLDESDYQRFEGLLRRGLDRYRIEIHAYALMPNHIHLLLYTVEAHLSRFMAWVLGIYARAFNQRHDRVGHLYQDRFKSKLVLSNDYALEVSRYIHMNPPKAGLSVGPQDYPWSSFGNYAGTRAEVPVTRTLIQERFRDPAGFCDFLEFTVARGLPQPDIEGWPERSDWYADDEDIEQPLAAPELDDILGPIADATGITVSRLCRSRRDPRVAKARREAARALRDEGRLPASEIASILNLRHPRSVYNLLH